jgi:DNA-binding transcriptional LysR family regulator
MTALPASLLPRNNAHVDIKLLEDLAALDRERSFARAADMRHVTHPAFGRRIRALEDWAGAALVDRSHNPVRLTAAGESLLDQVRPLVDGLLKARERLRVDAAAASTPALRLGTGTTLAQTLVADWLSQLVKPRRPLHGQRIDIVTGSMADIGTLMERGELDLVVCNHHPVSSIRLASQRFEHLLMAKDRLVPVSRADAEGHPLHALESDALIAFGPDLSMGAMLRDHLGDRLSETNARTRCVCDSPDAMHEFVLRGIGFAWLPWSMVRHDCKAGFLTVLGRRSDEVHLEVRLYRARAKQPPLVEAVWAAANR